MQDMRRWTQGRCRRSRPGWRTQEVAEVLELGEGGGGTLEGLEPLGEVGKGFLVLLRLDKLYKLLAVRRVLEGFLLEGHLAAQLVNLNPVTIDDGLAHALEERALRLLLSQFHIRLILKRQIRRVVPFVLKVLHDQADDVLCHAGENSGAALRSAHTGESAPA